MDTRNSICGTVSGLARRELNDLIGLYLFLVSGSCLFVRSLLCLFPVIRWRIKLNIKPRIESGRRQTTNVCVIRVNVYIHVQGGPKSGTISTTLISTKQQIFILFQQLYHLLLIIHSVNVLIYLKNIIIILFEPQCFYKRRLWIKQCAPLVNPTNVTK